MRLSKRFLANDKVDHAIANDKRTIKKKLLVPVSFAYLHKVKIELSHVQQMTSDQNINGVDIKLQLRGTIAHKPGHKVAEIKS